MGKSNKRNKTSKDKAVPLDVDCDADRFDSLAESDNEDADFRTVTVSLIELRNMIRNEVNSQLIDLNKSVVCLIDELRSDLASRLDCIDTRLNESLTNSKSVKQDFATLIDDMNLNFVKLKETVAKSSHTTHAKSIATAKPIDTVNLSDALFEVNERDKKKDNIIIFNAKENDQDDDIAVFSGICEAISVKTKPVKTFRIGKKSLGKSRPLIVKTDSVETKQQLLRNARKLNSLSEDDPRKKVVLKPDLTRREQETQKALFIELKARRERGETVYIRQGKIVTSEETK